MGDILQSISYMKAIVFSYLSLEFVPNGPFNCEPSSFQIMAWC